MKLTPENYEQWLDERGGQEAALRELLSAHDLTSGPTARMVGVTGRTFRRYLMKPTRGKPHPYPIPFSVLYTLLNELAG